MSLRDEEIIDAVVADFSLLADIPRPSGHEERVSSYLRDWFLEHGAAQVRQDGAWNLIVDLPATPGHEDRPLAALQAHLDMVCVSEPGVDYDPLRDPIRILRDDAAGTLTAAGTSLGGDDGIGVAFIMAIAEGRMPHGPLRAILTTGEENGMNGVRSLEPDCVEDAWCLINIDHEDSREVVLSTAAGLDFHVAAEVTAEAPEAGQALLLELTGLKGGHSGLEIQKGRRNAVITMGRLLRRLKESGIDYALASLEGGMADNAIPASARAAIAVGGSAEARKAVEEQARAYQAELARDCAGIEEGISLSVSEIPMPAQVLSPGDRDRVLRFVTELPDGVHAMSEDVEGLVESSSNLGIFRAGTGGIEAESLIRSSRTERLGEIAGAMDELAAALGWAVDKEHSAAPWPYNPDNQLLPLVRRAYRAHNGEDIRELAIHAGLECGTFAGLNPRLHMISIGPDVRSVHSTDETLHLSSLPRTWRLLEGILAGL